MIKWKVVKRVGMTIPLHFIIEILSWLPARSLVRFRRVCKLWLSITSDPQFVETNLDRSRKSRPPSVLFFLSHEDGDHCCIAVVDDDPKRTTDRLLIVPRSPDHCRGGEELIISRPCNGLVCISDFNGFIELLNPTTGERHTPPPPHHTGDIPIPYLGFHPETKEYKVVRLCRYFDEEWRIGCEVYTLGTNSWRQICTNSWRQIPYLDNCLLHYSTSVNANGALYWLIRIDGDYDPRDAVLLSFDLKKERFARISLPDFTRVYQEKRFFIGDMVELQGCACLQVYSGSHKRTDIQMTDIWMMVLSSNGDDNTTHEWALKYSVSCFMSTPLFIHNERILVWYSDEEPPALVYHHLDCKDGCTSEVYREGKPVRPFINHYREGQDGSNYEEFYRNTEIPSSEPFAHQTFAHVESLVSLRNQRHL